MGAAAEAAKTRDGDPSEKEGEPFPLLVPVDCVLRVHIW